MIFFKKSARTLCGAAILFLFVVVASPILARAKIGAGLETGAILPLSDRDENKSGFQAGVTLEAADAQMFFHYKRLRSNSYCLGGAKQFSFSKGTLRPFAQPGFGFCLVQMPGVGERAGMNPILGMGADLALLPYLSVGVFARLEALVYFFDTDEGAVAFKLLASGGGAVKFWF